MNEQLIRIAVPADLNDLRLCARLAYSRYVPRMGKAPEPMSADFEYQVAQGWVYVVQCKQAFAGFVVFYPRGDRLLLESVAVLPDRAGRGTGRALIDYVEQVARRDGFSAVELYTNEAMTENMAMYLALGYREVERKSQAGFSRVFYSKKI